MKRPALLLLALTLPLAPPAAGQPDPAQPDPEGEAELLLEELGEPDEERAPQLAELLAELAAHPVDVNLASAERIAAIPSISPTLAARIVLHRERHGRFRSLDGLAAVPGMTAALLERCRPYLTAGAPRVGRAWRVRATHRAGRRLETAAGYAAPEPAYLGSPYRAYTRLEAQNGRLGFNLTAENDPGEPLRWAPGAHAWGADHLALHAALREAGPLRALVAGDFQADFGLGLALGRSLFGQGGEPARVLAARDRGVVPYGSTDEHAFLRGVGLTADLSPRLAVSAFASRRRLDGTPTEAQGSPLRPRTAGLHRTRTEIARRANLTETLLGGGVAYRTAHGLVGAVFYEARFDPPLAGEPAPGAAGGFRRVRLGSAYAGFAAGPLYGSAEVARGPEGATAAVGGAVLRLARSAEAVVLARAYPRGFVSPHGRPFAERGDAPEDEAGVFSAVRLVPAAGWTLTAALDQFSFPGTGTGVRRPSAGHAARVAAAYRPRPWLALSAQLRSGTKETAVTLRDGSGRVVQVVRGGRPVTRQGLRLDGEYAFSAALRLRARVETSRVRQPEAGPGRGVVLLHGLRWQPHRRLRVDLRAAFFDTSDDARIYAFEEDVPGAFSAPALSGRGQRAYLVVHAAGLGPLDLSLKYAETLYEDVRSIGSGPDEVPGRRLRELRVQLRWQL